MACAELVAVVGEGGRLEAGDTAAGVDRVEACPDGRDPLPAEFVGLVARSEEPAPNRANPERLHVDPGFSAHLDEAARGAVVGPTAPSAQARAGSLEGEPHGVGTGDGVTEAGVGACAAHGAAGLAASSQSRLSGIRRFGGAARPAASRSVQARAPAFTFARTAV